MFGRMLQIESGENPPFEMDNRSKRSIVLDLTTAEGQRVAFELLAGADVFVTNVRPGALQRLGLDFEVVTRRNPQLVCGLITGYGMAGPDADRAAYDVAEFWARSGLADLLTRPGDTPPFQRGGMGDHSIGLSDGHLRRNPRSVPEHDRAARARARASEPLTRQGVLTIHTTRGVNQCATPSPIRCTAIHTTWNSSSVPVSRRWRRPQRRPDSTGSDSPIIPRRPNGGWNPAATTRSIPS
jgi:hypothetical protein